MLRLYHPYVKVTSLAQVRVLEAGPEFVKAPQEPLSGPAFPL